MKLKEFIDKLTVCLEIEGDHEIDKIAVADYYQSSGNAEQAGSQCSQSSRSVNLMFAEAAVDIVENNAGKHVLVIAETHHIYPDIDILNDILYRGREMDHFCKERKQRYAATEVGYVHRYIRGEVGLRKEISMRNVKRIKRMMYNKSPIRVAGV